ncbi:MAG: MarR family winged helix-turn-helix transcriptional regulator [Bacteroidia bacterium]
MTQHDINLADVYLFHLEKAYKQFKKYKSKVFTHRDINLTSDQWIVLKRVGEEPGISQKNLAQSTAKEPASITRILDILQKGELIMRESVSNDRRTYGVSLTKKGKQLIEDLTPLAQEIRAQGLKDISEDEKDRLVAMLDLIYKNFS